MSVGNDEQTGLASLNSSPEGGTLVNSTTSYGHANREDNERGKMKGIYSGNQDWLSRQRWLAWRKRSGTETAKPGHGLRSKLELAKVPGSTSRANGVKPALWLT